MVALSINQFYWPITRVPLFLVDMQTVYFQKVELFIDQSYRPIGLNSADFGRYLMLEPNSAFPASPPCNRESPLRAVRRLLV